MSTAIMILDPEEHTRWVLRTLLEGEGYKVVCAATMEEALKIISDFKFHALISEYWLGHSSSLGLIKRFKELFPDAYVMMLANNDVPENEYQEIINAGVDDFFVKPFPTRRILLHLQKGLRNHKEQNQMHGGFQNPKNQLGIIP